MTPAEEIAALKAENAALNEQVKALEAQLHELQARLAKDSHNSSKLNYFRLSSPDLLGCSRLATS